MKRLSECLLTAAHCMVRNVYTGPRQSVWFDFECKALKRNCENGIESLDERKVGQNDKKTE